MQLQHPLPIGSGMASSSSLTELFATPLLVADVPGAAALNAALLPRMLARREADPAGIGHSNQGGWHSDTRMLEWGGDEARELARWLGDLAARHTRDLGRPERPRFRWGARMWANVLTPGAANAAHAHPGACWSAVHHVDDGGVADDPSLGGELCLIDPRYPLVQQAAPDVAMLMADGAPMRGDHLVRPRPGLLVAFPSWLMHAVRPCRGRGLRVAVAINLSIVPTG